MMKGARFWLLFGIAAVIIAAGLLLWRANPRAVEQAEARVGSATELVYATGFIEARQPVAVAARVTAPVERVLVDEGDHVRRGQALLLLNDAEQRGQLAQAVSQRRQAALEESRTLALFQKGWVTRAARDRVVAEAASARAAEASALARRDQQVVRAGIDGIVLKRDVYPGDLATPSRTLLLLGDPGQVRVTATVDERDVPRLKVGQRALMSNDAWPDRVFRARLSEITPGGDPDQRAFRARLTIEDTLIPPIGMTMEVNIVTRQISRTLLIPATALADGHVWRIQNGRARRQDVRAGIAGADDVQILSGLAAGDTVIVNPPADLEDGERVRARRAAK
ncbi:MAG: efflux RND transporter periplasmic adaptor subunit [Sphingomonadaceae bacterium]